MLEFIRRQQQWLMIILAIVIIIAFAWLYDPNRGAAGKNPDFAMRLYGQDYRKSDLSKISSSYGIAQQLGLYQLVSLLPMADQRFANSGEGTPADYIVNLLVLREEAPRHGIDVTDAEVMEAISKLPAFQNNGDFDPARAEAFSELLKTRGMTDRDVYTVVKDNLMLEKMIGLLGAGILPSAGEANGIYERQFTNTDGNAFVLDRVNYEKVEVSDEEIQEFYNERKADVDGLFADKERLAQMELDLDRLNQASPGDKEARAQASQLNDSIVELRQQLEQGFRSMGFMLSEETREVDFVFFPEPEALDQLPTEERLEKQKAYNRDINEYSAMVVAEDADFDAITNQAGHTIQKSGMFTRVKPVAAFEGKDQLLNAIFDRDITNPVSDPVLVPGEGAYIFRLTGVTEPTPETVEQAREGIVEILTEQKITKNLHDAASAAQEAAAKAAEAGGDVSAAATAAGARLQTVPTFQTSTPPADLPEAELIAGLSMGIKPGEVSDVAATADGGLLFFHCTAKNLPEDPDKVSRTNAIRDRIASQDNFLAFKAWFQKVKDDAGLEH